MLTSDWLPCDVTLLKGDLKDRNHVETLFEENFKEGEGLLSCTAACHQGTNEGTNVFSSVVGSCHVNHPNT